MSRAIRFSCASILVLVCAVAAMSRPAQAYVGVSPTSLSFPDVTLPGSTSSQMVTITNHLGQALTFGEITASANFVVSYNFCGATLAADASCNIFVRFSPTASGALTGTLTINETNPAGTQTVALSGNSISGGIRLSATSLSFPDVTLPGSSSSQYVTLTNYTGQTVTFGPKTASTNFLVSYDYCGTTLATGASCKVYVRFTPTGSGTMSGTLTINETSPAGAQTVALSGTAIGGGVLLSRASLTFPDVALPGSTSSQMVTVWNYTGQTLTFGAITASPNFVLSYSYCGATLAAGSGCNLFVRFSPATPGAWAGTLTINETSPAGTQTVALSGNGISGGVQLSATSLSFPDVTLPGATSSQFVNLTNYTGQMVTFGEKTASANFTVSYDFCGSTLAVGATCKVYVRFSPTVSGALTGTLTINETSPAGVQSVALSGNSLSGGVQLSATSLSFPDVMLPGASSSQFVNVTNYTGQTLTFGEETASANFMVSYDFCGSTLAVGATCKVYVRFSPTAAGDLTGMLTINETSPAGTQTVALSGKAVGGGVQLSTTALNFPYTVKDTVSLSQVVQIKNFTGQPLTVASATTSGEFSVALNTCASPVIAGGSCAINVTFNPTVTGLQTGALTINDSDGVRMMSLSGVGYTADQMPVLQLHVSDSPARVNLDDPLVLDWVVWGADGSTAAPTRKAGVPNLISDFTPLPATETWVDLGGYIRYAWSNGTGVGPDHTGDKDLQPEVITYTDGSGYVITVPTDANVRTLNVYAGAGGRVTFEASVGDNSSPSVTDLSQATVENDKVYSIDYRAGKQGEILTVRLTVTGDDADRWLVLQAAALRQYAPRVFITSPVNGQSFAAPSDIPVLVEAVPYDSALSQVSVTADTGTPVVLPSAPYSTTLAAVTPGHHVLTAQATDLAGLVGSAHPAEVDVISSGGNLSVVVDTSLASGSQVNLTAEGTADWVLWGYKDATDIWGVPDPALITRKEVGGVKPALISNYTITGNHPPAYAPVYEYARELDYSFTFSDGDIAYPGSPQASQVCVDGEGNGFVITVPGGTSAQRLKLYIGTDKGKGKLTAFLSDGSAPVVVNQDENETGTDGRGVVARNTVYVIDFKAASPGQTLTIRFTLDKAYGWGDVNLHAATLQ